MTIDWLPHGNALPFDGHCPQPPSRHPPPATLPTATLPTATHPQPPTHNDLPTAPYPQRPAHRNPPIATCPRPPLPAATRPPQPTHSHLPTATPTRNPKFAEHVNVPLGVLQGLFRCSASPNRRAKHRKVPPGPRKGFCDALRISGWGGRGVTTGRRRCVTTGLRRDVRDGRRGV